MTEEQMKYFVRGIAYAAAEFVSTWGREVEAREVLRAAGADDFYKLKELGVDEYDLDRLAPLFYTTSHFDCSMDTDLSRVQPYRPQASPLDDLFD